ncbi:hypothetical protein [Cohnella nanjingensis]|uniref:Uncharacterized protein n=1 Tax=Cohnella nanjingensis TaxID=1387779 RepID=A0A7X0RLJ3_9BACL|nr:hypothetical protein [Cohnella nanjingensis]MBB6669576.1 hypothetical protein [Cohnella nanjingensis]
MGKLAGIRWNGLKGFKIRLYAGKKGETSMIARKLRSTESTVGEEQGNEAIRATAEVGAGQEAGVTLPVVANESRAASGKAVGLRRLTGATGFRLSGVKLAGLQRGAALTVVRQTGIRVSADEAVVKRSVFGAARIMPGLEDATAGGSQPHREQASFPIAGGPDARFVKGFTRGAGWLAPQDAAVSERDGHEGREQQQPRLWRTAGETAAAVQLPAAGKMRRWALVRAPRAQQGPVVARRGASFGAQARGASVRQGPEVSITGPPQNAAASVPAGHSR